MMLMSAVIKAFFTTLIIFLVYVAIKIKIIDWKK